MKKRFWQECGRICICLLALLLAVGILPVTACAADRNLSNVQFTTGKYGANCLTASNWSQKEKTLNLTQNVILDAAAQRRADQGELRLTASVRVGANGSRTNTRRLEVKFFDKNGNQVGSTQSAGSDSYSAKHHWNTLTLADRSVPKNTYRIQYYVYNHIGTKGALEIENCSLIIKDNVSPTLVNITAETNDGRSWNMPHPAGTKVTYTLHFSERVTANVKLSENRGVPSFNPSSTGVTAGAIKSTSDGTASTLSYTYTIPQNGDIISDSHNVALIGISAFTITDDAGNSTRVSLSEQGVRNLNSSLGSGGSLRMDNRPPEMTGITSEGFSKDSVLKAGETIKLHLKFHENISVPGAAPSITLSNGKTAAYIPTSTTTNLASFSYTVEAGDDINDLKISAFHLDGIVDGVNQKSSDSTRYASFTAANQGYMDVYAVTIDTSAPTTVLPAFTEDWLSTSAQVAVSASDDGENDLHGSGVKLVQYAWSQSKDTAPSTSTFMDLMDQGTGSFSVPAPADSGEWYLWIRSQDRAGNQSEPKCSDSAAWFDVTPPEITLNKTENGGKVFKVVPAFADKESGVAVRRYRWYNEKDELVLSGTLEAESNEVSRTADAQLIYPVQDGMYRLELQAKDTAGNITTCDQMVYVDTAKPVVTISDQPIGYWKSHTFTAQWEDAVSGVDRVEYQWKPGSTEAADNDWQKTNDQSFPSPQNENGTWRLYVRVTDTAGNQTVKSQQCLLDNLAPEITISPDGNVGIMGQESYDVTLSVQDPDNVTPQNLLKVAYCLSGSQEVSAEEEWTEVTDPTDITIQITPQEQHYLHVKAEDAAGNVGTKCSRVFAVDKNAPEGTIQLAYSWQNGTKQCSGNVMLTAKDDYDEPADLKMQISVDGVEGDWVDFSRNAAVSFAETQEITEHTISARFRDVSGNISEPVSVTVVYDPTPRAIKLTYSLTERTKGEVIVTAQLSDETYTWISEDSHTFSTNGTYIFQAKDKGGNTVTQEAKVTWIDRTGPVFTLTSDQADSTPHKTAAFTVQCEEEDLAHLYYRIYLSGGTESQWQELTETTKSLPELPDGRYVVEVYAVDDLGNESASRSLTIWLDNTPPQASVSYNPASRTSGNVTATLSLQDDSAVSVTNPENGSYVYEFTDNGSFTFCFTDAAGNSGTLEANVDWIDRSLPTLKTVITDTAGETNLASGQWTNQPVKVTLMLDYGTQKLDSLTFNDQSVMGEAIQSVEGIALVPNEADAYFVSTYGVLAYQITDTETNLTSNGSVLLAVDQTAPTCADDAISYSTKNWTNQDVTVSIQATDDRTENITYLRLEGGEYVADASGATFVFTQNGEHVFYFRDAAGNVGSKKVAVSWIDKEEPRVSVKYTTEDGQDYDPANWTNQNVTASLVYSGTSPITIPEGKDRYLFTANGSFVFEYTNAVGIQFSTTSVIDKIDKVAPTGYFTADIDGWTNQDVTVTLHASDDASGAENMTYTFTENETYAFLLRDRAGNETVYEYVMDRIDKQPPEITLTYTPGNLTKTPFAVHANAKADERVVWKDNCTSHRFEENGEWVFAATDRAGNYTEVTAKVDWISLNLPEVQLHYTTTESTNKDVTVELRPTDANNSVRILNNGGSRFYTFRENGSFTFQYTDMAGKNTGSMTAEVTWIDKTGPKLTAQADRTALSADPVTVTVTADEPVTWPNGMEVVDPQTAKVTFAENTAAQLWAEDALGNRGITQLEIQCIDNTPPVISMDSAFACIPKGQEFDPLKGITVEEPNPAQKPIRVDGSVDIQTVGTYTLTYTAVDAVGNQSTAQRTVTVYDPEEFHVQINNQLYLGRTVVVSPKDNSFVMINSEGTVSVKLLPGRAQLGDFKTDGTQVADVLLVDGYQFQNYGYVTLMVQDQERNTKLIELFVAK